MRSLPRCSKYFVTSYVRTFFFLSSFFFFTRWKGEGEIEGWGDYSFIEVTTSTHRITDQKNRTKKKDSQHVTIIYLYRSGDPRSQAWLAGIEIYPHLTRTAAKQTTKQEGGSSRGRGFVHRQPLLSFLFYVHHSAVGNYGFRLCFPSAVTERFAGNNDLSSSELHTQYGAVI